MQNQRFARHLDCGIFNIKIGRPGVVKIILLNNLRKFSSEILFLLMVTIIISFITLGNSFATDMSLENGKYKINSIRDSGPGSDTGCPAGYTVTSMFEDECTGEGTIKRTCPKDFSLDGSQCVSGVIIKDCPQGYHFERELVFGQTSIFCVGPAIEEVQCPSGFHKISENPRYCVGPRKF